LYKYFYDRAIQKVEIRGFKMIPVVACCIRGALNSLNMAVFATRPLAYEELETFY
jgi:hypothetical protein